MKEEAVFIIAEAGVNHNGQPDLAFALVEEAARIGADAVKFQTFDAAKLAAANAPKASYQKRTTDASESQREMLKKLELGQDLHKALRSHAIGLGIEFLSTAFDSDSLAFLLRLGVPRVKVPSGELTNAPLVWRTARSRLPLIISTGMATLSEVEQALAVVAHAYNSSAEPTSLEEVWKGWSNEDWRQSLRGHVTLMHCTSQYPAPLTTVNLRAMDTLARAFELDVGYSDHTDGILIPIAAVARGAVVIEKHFTLDRTMAGPDHAASLEPAAFLQMVQEIRSLTLALGDGRKAPQTDEWDTRVAARQQVVAARDIRCGATLALDDLTTARCGYGLEASALWSLVGSTSKRAFAMGEPIEA
jgi:N-acetylneuraminate synthase